MVAKTRTYYKRHRRLDQCFNFANNHQDGGGGVRAHDIVDVGRRPSMVATGVVAARDGIGPTGPLGRAK